MPRNKSDVWLHFKNVMKQNRHCPQCLYCSKQYNTVNATKMRIHLEHCKKAPSKIKDKFSLDQQKSNSNLGSAESSSGSKNMTLHSFIDSVTDRQQKQLEEHCARAIYSSCSPLSTTENKQFQHFIHLLRPSFKLPGRKKLSTTLLDKEYKKIYKAVLGKISQAESLTLLCDGWTDVNGVSLMNIIFATPDPVFLKTIESGVERHTSDFIFKTLRDEIIAVGADKVNAVVTDNAPNMKGAWNLIQQQYPHIIAYGCVAHGLNLLSKDFTKINSISRVVQVGKEIVQFFNNKHIPKHVFKRIQAERDQHPTTLKAPVETRWGTYTIMLDSLLKNKINLKASCVDKDLINILDNTVRKNIEDNNFWEKVEKSLKLLRPVLATIHMLEGDQATMAYVVKQMKEIEKAVLEVANSYSSNEKNKILEYWHNRNEFINHPVQLAAALLHPDQHTKFLSNSEVTKAMTFVTNLATQKGLDESEVLIDLAEYRSKTKDFSQASHWKVCSRMSAVTWWKGFFPQKQLSQLAVQILSMPATTGSCERNFKLHSNIKTKKRNKLTVERTEKLVFVKQNLKIFEQNDFDSDSENDSASNKTLSENETESENYDTDDIVEADVDENNTDGENEGNTVNMNVTLDSVDIERESYVEADDNEDEVNENWENLSENRVIFETENEPMEDYQPTGGSFATIETDSEDQLNKDIETSCSQLQNCDIPQQIITRSGTKILVLQNYKL